MQHSAIQVHRLQRHLLVERLHVGQAHAQALPGQQRAVVGHLHGHVAHVDLALQLEACTAARALLEAQLQLGPECTATGHHRQRLGQVGPPARQVEAIETDIELRRAAFGKRRAAPAAVEGAAVQREGQPRFDVDLQVVRQVRQEGQVECDVAHLVLLAHRLVVQIELSVGHAHVEQRKALRLAGRLGRWLAEALDQVVDVVVAIGQARQTQVRRFDLDRVEHRRQAQQRAHVDVDEHPFDLDLRCRCRAARGAGHRQLPEGQRQRGGCKFDLGHAQFAPEQLRAARFDLPFQQRRQCQPDQHTQQDQAQCRPHQPPQRT